MPNPQNTNVGSAPPFPPFIPNPIPLGNITFNAGFTGATDVPVSTMLSQFYSTAMAGAVADNGVTDNTTKFQNAATAAYLAGKPLYITPPLVNGNWYGITDEISIPSNLGLVYGGGRGTIIRQQTLDKNIFSSGSNNAFRDIQFQGNNNFTTVTNSFKNGGISCQSASNIEISHCYFQRMSGPPVFLADGNNWDIHHNTFFNNAWPTTAPDGVSAASVADVMLYSAVVGSGRVRICDNWMFSDFSQAIFNGLGLDTDIIIERNIIIPLDVSGNPITTNAGMVGRHGILATYNGATSTDRYIIKDNIIRYKKWTGIYIQSNGSFLGGPLIVSGNEIDFTGLETTQALGGGIYISGRSQAQGGGIICEGNTITNCQSSAASGAAAIIIQRLSTNQIGEIIVKGNKIFSCAGVGINFLNYCYNTTIDGNEFNNNVDNDIKYIPASDDVANGDIRLINNKIVRVNGTANAIYFAQTATAGRRSEIKGNWIRGVNSGVNAAANAAIFVGTEWTARNLSVVGNHIELSYYGIVSGFYWTTAGRYIENFNVQGNEFDTVVTAFTMDATGGSVNQITVGVAHGSCVNVTNRIGLSPLAGTLRVWEVARTSGGRVIIFDAAAPIAGNWIDGDIQYNNDIVATTSPGNMCSAAGTPGTWRTLPAIA